MHILEVELTKQALINFDIDDDKAGCVSNCGHFCE